MADITRTETNERIAPVLVRMHVNGTEYEEICEPRMLLSDFIRDVLGLTGTHTGCEHGVCGACTVLVNGRATRSCLMFAIQAQGAEIVTIEGLVQGGKLHPLQEEFSKNHALQCGFCTPGMILTALDYLQREPNPSERQIREAMSGNICRCTGYESIVRAIQAAAPKLAGSEQP